MPGTALIIVDLLNDFFERSPVLAAQRAALVTATNRLARGVRAAGSPVFWVRQEFAPDLGDAFLDMRRRNIAVTISGTRGCQLLPELEQRPEDIVVVKKRYSAFYGTDFEQRLSQLRPDLLIVAGVNTHACVRMTVIDAYQRDYDVVVASDCVTSYDPEHHDVTVRYLDGKVARFLPSGEILTLLPPKHA